MVISYLLCRTLITTAKALEKCNLTVQISTKLNRSHLITGDVGIILPCLGRTDQQVTSHGPQLLTVENSMGIVHVSRGHNIRSTMAIKPEPTIISSIGTKLLRVYVVVRYHGRSLDQTSIR